MGPFKGPLAPGGADVCAGGGVVGGGAGTLDLEGPSRGSGEGLRLGARGPQTRWGRRAAAGRGAGTRRAGAAGGPRRAWRCSESHTLWDPAVNVGGQRRVRGAAIWRFSSYFKVVRELGLRSTSVLL